MSAMTAGRHTTGTRSEHLEYSREPLDTTYSYTCEPLPTYAFSHRDTWGDPWCAMGDAVIKASAWDSVSGIKLNASSAYTDNIARRVCEQPRRHELILAALPEDNELRSFLSNNSKNSFVLPEAEYMIFNDVITTMFFDIYHMKYFFIKNDKRTKENTDDSV